MKVAALDLGTNTFLMLIIQGKKGQIQKVLEDRSSYVRLGEGLQENGFFSKTSLDRADKAFKDFRKLINEHNIDRIKAVATSAARDSKNKEELFQLAKTYDFPLEIIEGEKEASLTFQGCLFDDADSKDSLVVDVGGGSTELVFLEGDTPQGISLDIGGVRLTELCVEEPLKAIPTPSLKAMEKQVERAFKPYESLFKKAQAFKAIASGGTPCLLAQLPPTQPSFLSSQKLSELRDFMASKSWDERKKIKGMDPLRADILVAGCTILKTLGELLTLRGYKVSSKGVRFGLALELLTQPFV